MTIKFFVYFLFFKQKLFCHNTSFTNSLGHEPCRINLLPKTLCAWRGKLCVFPPVGGKCQTLSGFWIKKTSAWPVINQSQETCWVGVCVRLWTRDTKVFRYNSLTNVLYGLFTLKFNLGRSRCCDISKGGNLNFVQNSNIKRLWKVTRLSFPTIKC